MTTNAKHVAQEQPLEERVRNKAKELEGDLRKSLEQTTDFVRENPLLALAGAFAVGYLVAKVTTRRK
jgi:ElaB/YqjD/DUF883 family membrane-anchored ribosome-binding protein